MLAVLTWWNNRGSDRRAVMLALLATVLGVALAAILKAIGVSGAGAFVALIFLPVVVYLLASDKLDEIGGPGGWTLKLRRLALQTVGDESGQPVDATNLEIIMKGSRSALGQIEERLRDLNGAPFALTLILGQSNYNAPDLLRYLRLMMAFDPELPVILMEPNKGFVAATLGTKIASLLGESLESTPDSGSHSGSGPAEDPNYSASKAFVNAIADKDLDTLKKLVSITGERLKPGQTNLQALQLMLKEDMSLLITVDDSDRPVGIVKRDPLVARMLSEMLIEPQNT